MFELASSLKNLSFLGFIFQQRGFVVIQVGEPEAKKYRFRSLGMTRAETGYSNFRVTSYTRWVHHLVQNF